MLLCPKLGTGCAAAHHFLVRGETYGHPAVCVCTHLILHICPNAAVTQEVVTRLCIAPRLPISVQTQMNTKHKRSHFKAPQVSSENVR